MSLHPQVGWQHVQWDPIDDGVDTTSRHSGVPDGHLWLRCCVYNMTAIQYVIHDTCAIRVACCHISRAISATRPPTHFAFLAFDLACMTALGFIREIGFEYSVAKISNIGIMCTNIQPTTKQWWHFRTNYVTIAGQTDRHTQTRSSQYFATAAASKAIKLHED